MRTTEAQIIAKYDMYSEQFTTLRELKRCRVEQGMIYDVAYLVRMKNEAASLPEMIKSIEEQAAGSRTAILIFLDSGSSDESLRVAEDTTLPHIIYAIDPREFQFGATCNLIAQLASARYLMFLSGHVVLKQSNLVAASIDYMDAHERVAGLSFRQVPNAATGFNLYEQIYLARTFPRLREGYVEIGRAGAFSNAASLIRASAWQSIPFEPVVASEDHLWAEAAKARGFDVLYSSHFDVAHSHNESPEAVFKRVRINKLARFGEGRQPVRFLKSLFGVFAVLWAASKGRRPRFAITYALAHAAAYVSSASPFARRS